MKRRKRIYLILIILLLGVVMIGCQSEDKEKAKEESDSQSIPSAMDQVQQLSDEIVTLTMAKDWAGCLNKVKELQSNWNALYPDIQKQGVSEEDVDAFVTHLNTLTDDLISKNLNLVQEQAKQEKTDGQSQEQSPQQSPQQSPAQNSQQGQEQGSQQSPQQSPAQSPQQSPAQNSQQGQEQGSQQSPQQSPAQSPGQEQGTSQSSEGESKNPEEILNEIDPIISASKEELTIIASSVEVTKYIPKFLSLFENPIPPNLFKLKYLVRHLYVMSKLEDWNTVSSDFKSIMDTWESVQPQVLETDANLRTQLVQSINELEDVIESENANLTGVKCNFIIQQIESVSNTIKEKETKKQE
jgi:hypothetical protein